MLASYLEAVTEQGFAIVPDVASGKIVDDLVAALTHPDLQQAAMRRGGIVYGMRNLLRLSPAVRALADNAGIRALVEPVLGQCAHAVRGIFFDKTPAANWGVDWHQDLAIPVKTKRAVADFGPWSIKGGVPHALAPATVLENMLTVRLHLDDAAAVNGALQVIPSSHLSGRISDQGIAQWVQERLPVMCAVSRGGVLVMRPLLLHASAAAQTAQRRVIHLEFAAGELPQGLTWGVA